MKKILLFASALAIFTTTFAFSVITSLPKKATELYVPIGNNVQISLQDLSTMKVKDYEKLSGNHLNFFQRMTFRMGQRKLRASIASDGTITNKKLLNAMTSGDMTSGFNAGWFVLGLILGLIGVLLSYLIKGDPDVKRNRQKWAWIGWGVWVVILVLTLVL